MTSVSLDPGGPTPVHLRPGFAEAVRHSTRAPLAILDREPDFYRCISDIPTYALGVLALHLHALDRLNHRGLREAAKDLFSAGRASAILKRMQTAGLIVPIDTYQSGRQRRYGPAPAMVTAFRAAYRIELTSLAMLDPRVAAMLDDYENPAVFDGIVAFIASAHLAAPTLDQQLIEPLAGIGRRSMGLFFVYGLAETAFDAGLPRAEGAIWLNLSKLSRRLGVSRTQGRRNLTMLEAAGLVKGGERPDQWVLTAAFAEAYDLYFFGMFTGLLMAVGCWDG